MLYRFFFCVFLIANLAFLSIGQGKILDDYGQVTPAVRNVFQLLKIWIQEKNKTNPEIPKKVLQHVFKPEGKIPPPLEDLNTIAQSAFRRPQGVERFQMLHQKNSPLEKYKDGLFAAFKEIGDLDAVHPTPNTKYDYILLNGSTVSNMRDRLATLVTYVENKELILTEGIQLVFLTGKRELSTKDGEIEALRNLNLAQQDPGWREPEKTPETEDEAAQWIWNQTKLPPSLRQLTPTFVVAEKKLINGEWERPNTADTVTKWAESAPKPGKCVVFSSQPFVYYQEITTISNLKKAGLEGFTVEGVGDAPNEQNVQTLAAINILLDNLARTIYTVLEAQKLEDAYSTNKKNELQLVKKEK